MHRSIVPTEDKLATSEGPVALLPYLQIDYIRQDIVKYRKSASQQYRKIDALRIVIQLSSVYRQPRPAGERLGQTSVVKHVSNVVIDPTLNGFGALTIPCEGLDFCQRFEDKAGMEMVDEIAFAIKRIAPGAIRVLRSKDEIQIALCRFPIPRI